MVYVRFRMEIGMMMMQMKMCVAEKHHRCFDNDSSVCRIGCVAMPLHQNYSMLTTLSTSLATRLTYLVNFRQTLMNCMATESYAFPPNHNDAINQSALRCDQTIHLRPCSCPVTFARILFDVAILERLKEKKRRFSKRLRKFALKCRVFLFRSRECSVLTKSGDCMIHCMALLYGKLTYFFGFNVLSRELNLMEPFLVSQNCIFSSVSSPIGLICRKEADIVLKFLLKWPIFRQKN